MKVIALYDFQAQPDTGEISITKDEMITGNLIYLSFRLSLKKKINQSRRRQ